MTFSRTQNTNINIVTSESQQNYEHWYLFLQHVSFMAFYSVMKCNTRICVSWVVPPLTESGLLVVITCFNFAPPLIDNICQLVTAPASVSSPSLKMKKITTKRGTKSNFIWVRFYTFSSWLAIAIPSPIPSQVPYQGACQRFCLSSFYFICC